MKLIYTPYTPKPTIIHPSELEPGEVGQIVCWFTKDNSLVGYFIEGGLGSVATIASNKECLNNIWFSTNLYVGNNRNPRHLYQVEVLR